MTTAATTPPSPDLSLLPLAEKRKIIMQVLQEEEQAQIARARLRKQLFAELFPGSSVGELATEEELLWVLWQTLNISADGYLPNVRALFAKIGEATGRVEKWAKVNSAAKIPKQLKTLLPKLSDHGAMQEVTAGGMMTDTEQMALCGSSPANFAKVFSRNLGRVRQNKTISKLVLEQGERLREAEMQILSLQAATGTEDAWLQQAVEMRKAGASWDIVTAAVKKKRVIVIARVKAALQVEIERGFI